MAYTPKSLFKLEENYTPSSVFSFGEAYTPKSLFKLEENYTPSSVFSFGEAYTPKSLFKLEENYTPSSVFSFGGLKITGAAATKGVIFVTVEQIVFPNIGTISHDILQTLVYGLSTVSAPIHFTTVSGAVPITLVIKQNNYLTGLIAADVSSVIEEAVYVVSAGVSVNVYGSGVLGTVVGVSIYNTTSGSTTTPAGTLVPAGLTSYNYGNPAPGQPTKQTGYWTTVVLLKGLDVSVNLTGQVVVDNEESAASVATFTLKPTAGLVDLTSWVRAKVLITYVTTDKEKVPQGEFLLFNGFVDVPTYDPQTKLTTFVCTDELQRAFESKTKQQIADVIGGFWSPEVFNEDSDNWTYALDRLSTIPYAADYSVNRVIVKTPLAAKAVADLTFNKAVVLDNTVSVELGNSRGITNQIDISFNYQYDTFKEVVKSYQWQMRPSISLFTILGAKPVTYSMVLEAAQTDGWVLTGEPKFTPWPQSGWYDGRVIINSDREMVVGVNFTVAKRYNQYINEITTFSLKSPKSIASLGKLVEEEEYSLQTEYSDQAGKFADTAEAAGEYTATLNTYYASSVLTDSESGEKTPVNPSWVGEVPVNYTYQAYSHSFPGSVVGGTKYYDLTSTIQKNDRASVQNIAEVVQNLHKTAILASHRGNSVQFSCLIEPTVTRSFTVKLDTDEVAAKGKVRQITHTLDIDAGSALSSITLGISRSTAVGITDAQDPLDSSLPAVEAGINDEVSNISGLSSLGNWVAADAGAGAKPGSGMEADYSATSFLVPLPAVSDSNISEITVTNSLEFIVEVPDEELILNA